MQVARESYPYLLVGSGVAAAGIVLGFPWIGSTAAVFTAFIAFFFRDPARSGPEDSAALVSPADGRVVEVEPDHPAGGTRVAIFLSLWDVHINRSPVAGRIEKVEYRPGRFLPANLAKASVENERNAITVDSQLGRVCIVQIAGVVARRIVCWKAAGDSVERGERIGLIQFGSRVEVHLPEGVAPAVGVGSRVRGGSTILAKLEPALVADRGGALAQATGR